MLYNAFYDFIRCETTRSAHTVLAYKRDLEQFRHFLTAELLHNDDDPTKATYSDLRLWVSSLSSQGLATTTILRKISALRAFYSYLMRHHNLQSNPAARLVAPRAPSVLPVFITPDDTARVIDTMDAFSENFEEAEGVETILKWDCTNGFRDYFFAGGYLELAGEDGDDSTKLDVTSDNLVQAMTYFQSMYDFFSIDIDSVSEEQVLSEFIAGKTVFVFGDTGYIPALAQSGMENYGVAVLPMLNDTLASRGIAVTDVAVVNGFSQKQDAAAKFVHALTVDYSSTLYDLTEKVPACITAKLSREECKVAQEQYASCRQLPKLMNLGDFWVQLEITMTDIWKGAEVGPRLEELKIQLENRLAE